MIAKPMRTKRTITKSGAAANPRLRRLPRPVGKLKAERVQKELRSMPGWRLREEGNALARTYKLTETQAAAQLAAHVAGRAAAERRAVTLGVAPGRVTLTLQRPSRNGIDMPLLDFARRLG